MECLEFGVPKVLRVEIRTNNKLKKNNFTKTNNMKSGYKNIKGILPPPHFHMVGDGFRVHNFFPSNAGIGLDGMSPFFLMDYGSKWHGTAI